MAKEIKVSSDNIDYIQRLNYECNGLNVLHMHAIRSGLSRELTKEIRDEFISRYTELQLVQQEIVNSVAPGAKRWTFVYDREVVIIDT